MNEQSPLCFFAGLRQGSKFAIENLALEIGGWKEAQS